MVPRRTPVSEGELTDLRQLQLEFWTAFHEFLIERSSVIDPGEAHPLNAMTYAIGHAHFVLQAVIKVQEQSIELCLAVRGPDRKAHYHLLHRQKGAIEASFGEPLGWYERPEKKSNYITLYRGDTDLTDHNRWAEQHRWMADKLETIHRVFSERIQRLNPADYAPA
jgi:hypothetical protein